MPVVFLSSPYAEMEEYRKEAIAAIQACGHRCIYMEVFPASGDPIDSFCADRVKECDVFVLLLGRFYGTPIPGREISYTEDEFDTALALGKPRLVFIPGPKARTDSDAALNRIRAGGLLFEDQNSRQERFIKKAMLGLLPRPYSDPGDLKFQIATSLNHHFPKRDDIKDAPKRYAGEMLPLLCDRGRQFYEFGKTFQAGKPGQPEIYVLQGHELEQHKNCVRRLTCFHITYPMKTQAAGVISPPADRAIVDWPYDDEEEILFNRLRSGLFQALRPAYTFPQKYAAGAFCQLAMDTQASYLLFRHVIRTQNWTAAAQSLCTSRYLPFWSEVGKWFAALPDDKRRPRILVFFEFKHRFAEKAEGQAFQESLCGLFEKNTPEDVVCQVLPELPQVQLTDVDGWYGRYEKFLLPQHQDQATSDLFPELPLPMIRVEKRLRDLLGLEANAN